MIGYSRRMKRDGDRINSTSRRSSIQLCSLFEVKIAKAGVRRTKKLLGEGNTSIKISAESTIYFLSVLSAHAQTPGPDSTCSLVLSRDNRTQ